ncbi:MAG: flippase-like domain-containing protein [Bacteroidia bacterium]|nr:flippase-like domain-containing protein [Bacteroidia bacterium]NNM23201.1 flippase-like domain-containing protein [Flavobacteriaceae bacterium]
MQIALPLGLGFFLMWYFYSKYTPEQKEEVFSYLKNANYWIVGVAVVLSVISHLIRAYRWNLMLEPMGYKPKLLNNFFAVSIAYLMNIFIPRSGEVSRAVVLSTYEKVPFDKGFGTIISERVIDLLFLMIFTLIALTLQFDSLYAFITEKVPLKEIGLALAGLLALLVLFVLFLKYSQSGFSKKIKELLSGLKEGILSILKMRRKWNFLVQSFIIWILYIASFYVSTLALEATAGIELGVVIITFVVGSFTFAFTNSGFGYYPLAIAGILLVFGIQETVGTALGWIVWTSNILYIIASGVFSFIVLPIYNRKRL